MFYYYLIFPNRQQGITIKPLVLTKICCISCLNIWRNLLDTFSKRQTVIIMKVDRKKVIYPEFGRKILDGFIDYYNDLILVDQAINRPMCHLQYLICLRLFLIHLQFIIWFIVRTCPSFLLLNLSTLRCKWFEILSDINVILEEIIWEECPPLRKISYYMQIIFRDRCG